MADLEDDELAKLGLTREEGERLARRRFAAGRGPKLKALREQLAGPDGLAEIERLMRAPSPPPDIEHTFSASPLVRVVEVRRWRQDRPGVRTPEVYRREIQCWAGDEMDPETLTPAGARELAAALAAAAEWMEARS